MKEWKWLSLMFMIMDMINMMNDDDDDDDGGGGGDDGKRNAWQGCDPSSRISSLSVHLFNLIVIKGSTNIIITITICSGCYHYDVQQFCS